MADVRRGDRCSVTVTDEISVLNPIDFKTAVRVFEDPNMVLVEDRIDEEGEQRWHALGMLGGRFLLVIVHVYREAENG